MAVVTFPSVSKDVSSEPSALYLTIEKFLFPALLAESPTATIFPSVCKTTALAKSFPLSNAVVTFPSVSKVVSSEPSVLYLTRA